MKKSIIRTTLLFIVSLCSIIVLASCSSENTHQIFSGVEDPVTTIEVKVGDYYFDEDDFTVYKFTDEGWQLILNVKGIDGANGIDGVNGSDGTNGADGLTPHIGENGNWWIGETDTEVKAVATDGKDGNDGVNGVDGKDGKDGADGKDGINGTDGKDGKDGVDGVNGIDGTNGVDGVDGVDGVGVTNTEVALEYDQYGQKYFVFTFYYTDESTSEARVLIPEKSFVDNTDEIMNAFKTAKDGDVVNLIGDIVIEGESAITVDKDVTLKLNGFSISAPNDTHGDGVFHVVEGGKLTIEGDGEICGINKTDYAMAIWADGGEVVINGGTYTNVGAGEDDQYDLIYVKNGGKVTINGGKFVSETPKWTLNVHDTNGGEIVVMGGEFFGYNPASSDAEVPPADFVAEGYVATEIVDENGVSWYKIVKVAN